MHSFRQQAIDCLCGISHIEPSLDKVVNRAMQDWVQTPMDLNEFHDAINPELATSEYVFGDTAQTQLDDIQAVFHSEAGQEHLPICDILSKSDDSARADIDSRMTPGYLSQRREIICILVSNSSRTSWRWRSPGHGSFHSVCFPKRPRIRHKLFGISDLISHKRNEHPYPFTNKDTHRGY